MSYNNSRIIHGQQQKDDPCPYYTLAFLIILIGSFCSIMLGQLYRFPKFEGFFSEPTFSMDSFDVTLAVANSSSSSSSEVTITADWSMAFFLTNPYWKHRSKDRRIAYQQLDITVLYNTSTTTRTTTESLGGGALIEPFVLTPSEKKLVRASQKNICISSNQLANKIIQAAETRDASAAVVINFNVQIHAKIRAFWAAHTSECGHVDCEHNRNLKHEIWLNCENLGLVLSSTSTTTASGSMLPEGKVQCSFH